MHWLYSSWLSRTSSYILVHRYALIHGTEFCKVDDIILVGHSWVVELIASTSGPVSSKTVQSDQEYSSVGNESTAGITSTGNGVQGHGENEFGMIKVERVDESVKLLLVWRRWERMRAGTAMLCWCVGHSWRFVIWVCFTQECMLPVVTISCIPDLQNDNWKQRWYGVAVGLPWWKVT